MHNHTNVFKRGKINVIECLDCGYKHLFPMPTPTQLDEFYKDHYEESTPSPNIDDKKESILELIGGGTARRILDVGAWNGDFLDLFKDKGWERVAIEPNRQKRSILESKGIHVFCDVFDNIDKDILGKFDVVNLAFVLEHLREPRKMLEEIFTILLKPGGIICAEVPNEFNPFQMAIVDSLEMPLYWLTEIDHINYFDSDSLEKILVDTGFEILIKEGDFPVEFFALAGENYLKDKEIGPVIHRKRCRFEENLQKAGLNDLKRKIYRCFAELNVGRSIMIFARKPII